MKKEDKGHLIADAIMGDATRNSAKLDSPFYRFRKSIVNGVVSGNMTKYYKLNACDLERILNKGVLI